MRVLRWVATVALVLGLVVGGPAAASAATISAPSVVPAVGPDFTPSGNKWREFMINVTSRVLGGATPHKWRAEQLANQYRYNWSWENLNVQYGYDAANPNFVTNPDSYDDYVLRDLEERRANGGPNNREAGQGRQSRTVVGAPATATSKWLKAGAAAGGAFIGLDMGMSLGAQGTNLVGGWFGFDAQGVVCANIGDGVGGSLLQWASGQDCDAWVLANTYEPNFDAGDQWSAAEWNGGRLNAVAWVTAPNGNAFVCYDYQAPHSWVDPDTGDRVSIKWLHPNGTWFTASPPSVENISPDASWTRCLGISSYFAFGQAAGVPYPDTGGVYWFMNNANEPVGTPPVMGAEDPERYLECTVTYDDGTTASLVGETYRESSGSIVPPPCPPTPPDRIPQEVQIDEQQVGGPRTTISEEPTTDEYRQWLQDYPECQWGNCKLDLLISTGTGTASCFDLEDGCAGWFEDPQKQGTYLCRYGMHDVDLEECNVYAGLFEPGRVEAGAAYSDPATGTWSGGQSAPKSGQTAMAQPVQDPTVTRSCDFSGLGFDPVGWVLRPVQCALEWAFVPRPTVVEVSMGASGQAWAGKPPAVIADAVRGVSVNPGASGCAIPISFMGVSADIVNVCSGPMALLPIASKLITGGVMVIIVFNLVRRQIAGMAGYAPGQG